jgi:hypothetical protein
LERFLMGLFPEHMETLDCRTGAVARDDPELEAQIVELLRGTNGGAVAFTLAVFGTNAAVFVPEIRWLADAPGSEAGPASLGTTRDSGSRSLTPSTRRQPRSLGGGDDGYGGAYDDACPAGDVAGA